MEFFSASSLKCVLRPLPVDSLNGGSTDALQKAPVGKNLENFERSYLCPYYSSRLILGMFVTNGSFFLPDRPTAEKNPPFKELTDCGLTTATYAYLGQGVVSSFLLDGRCNTFIKFSRLYEMICRIVRWSIEISCKHHCLCPCGL